MAHSSSEGLSPIAELVDDIRQGKMVILMDDEDRENEGDIIMAAEMVKPEHINSRLPLYIGKAYRTCCDRNHQSSCCLMAG